MIKTHLLSTAYPSAKRAARRDLVGRASDATPSDGGWAHRRPVREALRTEARVLTDVTYRHHLHLMATRFLPENLPNQSDGS